MKVLLLVFLMIISVTGQELFVFAGQSNMQGYGLESELTAEELDNSGIYGWDWNTKSWVHNPDPRYNHNVFHAERLHGLIIHDMRDNFGPELATLRYIHSKINKPVYFIKYAVGSSWLDDWVYTYANRIQQEISLCGRTADAWFWMQGETDAQFLGSSQSYKQRFSNFITSINKPFFVCEINSRWPHHENVNNAFRDLNDSGDLSLIPSKFLPVYSGDDNHPDGLNTAHYTSDGVRLMGVGFALSYIYHRLSTTMPELSKYIDKFGKDLILWNINNNEE